MPGHKCEEGWPTLNMNGWMGGEVAASNPCGGTPVGEPLQCSCRLMYSCCPFAAPFVFEEYLHPTAWVGQQVGTASSWGRWPESPRVVADYAHHRNWPESPRVV